MQTLPLLPEHFPLIARHIRAGNLLILPSETSYGFSGSPWVQRGVEQVEHIKGREQKPFLLLTETPEQMTHYSDTSQIESLEYFTDPSLVTTFLLPKKSTLPTDYFPDFPEIGIRQCSYAPITGFLHFFGEPIFSTSANISGQPALYTEKQVQQVFRNVPNILFISVGDLPKNEPSRIIRVQNGSIEFIRGGEKKR